MKRRDFFTLVAGAAASPLVARAQQAPVPVVGFLNSRSPEEAAVHTAAFRRGLSEAGFVDGQNVTIVFRWAEGRYERLPALAKELVDLRVSAIWPAVANSRHERRKMPRRAYRSFLLSVMTL